MSEIDDRLDRLESQLDRHQQRIDDQQATIEDQQATIESQQATIEEQREQIADLQGDGGTTATEAESTVLNRRNALKAGGLLALLFGSAGTASADSQGQVGTSSDPLGALYTDELYGNSGTVTVQDDLDINGNTLTSTSAGTDLLMDVDSTVSGEEDFALEIEDASGNEPTVRWRREPNNNNAFRVVTDDGTTTRTRLRLDDDGTLGVHGDITKSEAFTIETTVTGDLTLNAADNVALGSTLDTSGNDLEDGGTTVWDSGNKYVPQSQLQNDSVSVSAGTGLDGGGSASLGESTTLDVASDGIGPTELANAQFREPTTKTLSPGFGSWTEVDANRPAFLEVDVRIFAKNGTGFADGIVDLNIDESGGTSANITYKMRVAGNTLDSGPNGNGSTDDERRFRSVYIPAGGQYQLKNTSSPDGFSNSIETVRAIIG